MIAAGNELAPGTHGDHPGFPRVDDCENISNFVHIMA